MLHLAKHSHLSPDRLMRSDTNWNVLTRPEKRPAWLQNRVPRVQVLLPLPDLQSLYFEKSTEMQAFLLPIRNSLGCIFAVACEEKTGKIHTNSHEIHTKKRRYNVIINKVPFFMKSRAPCFDFSHFIPIGSIRYSCIEAPNFTECFS